MTVSKDIPKIIVFLSIFISSAFASRPTPNDNCIENAIHKASYLAKHFSALNDIQKPHSYCHQVLTHDSTYMKLAQAELTDGQIYDAKMSINGVLYDYEHHSMSSCQESVKIMNLYQQTLHLSKQLRNQC